MEEEVRNGKKLSLYFVRHGQTYLNKNLRMQGWADTPLTPEGIEVVKESGRGLAETEFVATLFKRLTPYNRNSGALT